MPKRTILFAFAAVVLLSVVLLAGCASPQALPIPPTAIPTLAPATMPAVTAPAGGAPPSGGAPSLTQGQQTFLSNCSPCHNLTNVTKVGPGLAILQTPNLTLPSGKPLNNTNLADWIHTGGGGMPPFVQIQGGELDSLIAFLLTATKTGGTLPAETPAPSGTSPAPAGSPAAPAGSAAASPVASVAPPSGSPAAALTGIPAAAANLPGAAIFNNNCSTCHTLDTQTKVGPGLAILQTPNLKLPNSQPLNDANLANWIHTGAGGMPGFDTIQGTQMDQLIQFLKAATQGAAAPAGGTPAGTGPGATVFSANCSPCHNLTLETKVGPGLAVLGQPNTKLPNGKPVTDQNIADWIHSGGGGMPPFTQIQGDQLNSLIVYLKQATGAATTAAPSAASTAAPSAAATGAMTDTTTAPAAAPVVTHTTAVTAATAVTATTAAPTAPVTSTAVVTTSTTMTATGTVTTTG
jgi:cytochrome c